MLKKITTKPQQKKVVLAAGVAQGQGNARGKAGRRGGQGCQVGTGKCQALFAVKRGRERVAGAAAKGKGNFFIGEGVK